MSTPTTPRVAVAREIVRDYRITAARLHDAVHAVESAADDAALEAALDALDEANAAALIAATRYEIARAVRLGRLG